MKGPPQMTDADYRHATLAHQLAALENARELIDRTIKNLLVLRQIGCSALGQGVEGSVGSDRSDECPNEGVARAEVVVNAGGRPGHGASDSASVRHEPDPPYGSEAWLFRELMAMMHGDGGHYHAQHGRQKAFDDAVKKYYALVTKADQPTVVTK